MSFNTSFLQVMNGAPADWAAADKLIPSGFIGRDSTTGVCRIGTGLPFSQSTLFFAPPIFRRLTSIFPSSSNVRANVTGAAFDCEAGRGARDANRYGVDSGPSAVGHQQPRGGYGNRRTPHGYLIALHPCGVVHVVAGLS